MYLRMHNNDFDILLRSVHYSANGVVTKINNYGGCNLMWRSPYNIIKLFAM